jgi:hypothetical protein
MRIEDNDRQKRLVVHAEPPNAQIHHAIEIMLNQIDDELQLCATLAVETPFDILPGSHSRLSHRWDLLPSMQRRVTPKDNAYEYIDGAFRPDTPRLLELLSGVELYDSPFAAVRELLQNALDAVREQIAYKRLDAPDPNDPQLLGSLGRLYDVDLRLDVADGRIWLVCVDKGVGMTKAIIRDHLLVSGRSRREDVLALQRRCREKGFFVERTGQFGIGVLSYFMLADQVRIRTRRSIEAGATERNGWSFETEGIGYFGQLKVDPAWSSGTEVRLRMQKGFSALSRLIIYVKEMLLDVPCRIRFASNIGDVTSWELQPDWAAKDMDLVIQELIARSPFDNKSLMTELIKIEKLEGVLPSGLGRFRILIPYFNLPGGASLAFLNVEERDGGLPVGSVGRSGSSYVLIFSIEDSCRIVGWKGMRIKRETIEPQKEQKWAFPVIVQINWTSNDAGRIVVNRTDIHESEKAKIDRQWLTKKADALLEDLLQRHQNSVYAGLNSRLAGQAEESVGLPSHWLSVRNQWEAVTLPAAVISRPSAVGLQRKLTWNGQLVFLLRPLNNAGYRRWVTPVFPLAPSRL